eukprot:gnl/Trimastix_PCT/3941.p1 GENE.gnl/Trimastix_PCT/3941~~gnl/Trimastix_PCT/3941.p1  ORF type:complete len:345 (+),score=62.77 gnl/Trimastix_PCT/3941:417-1451(+)
MQQEDANGLPKMKKNGPHFSTGRVQMNGYGEKCEKKMKKAYLWRASFSLGCVIFGECADPMSSPEKLASLQCELWRGHVPIVFTLAAHEKSTIETPEPYYCLLPRISYFPLYLQEVIDHFSSYILPLDPHVWLEFEGKPIKWTRPIGVLFDLHCGVSQGRPWHIAVHFQGFPEDQVVRCNAESMEMHFMQCLKEATFLRNGSIKHINALSKSETQQLFTAVQRCDASLYMPLRTRLHESEARCVPLRVHVPGRFIQQPLPFPVPEGAESPVAFEQGEAPVPPVHTLGEALQRLLPAHFRTDAPAPPALIHGIQPPLDTPITWVADHLASPDGFVHVAVAVSGAA